MNKHTPTEENKQRAKSLAAAGMPKDAIANMLTISVPTLRKYYADELHDGKWAANYKVAAKLFEQCMEGNMSALIFWAKTQMGWKETVINETIEKIDASDARTKLLQKLKAACREDKAVNE